MRSVSLRSFRTWASLLGIALVAALVAVAIAIPLYLQPRMLKLPADLYSSSVAVGTATMIDPAALVNGRLVVLRDVPIRSRQIVSVVGRTGDRAVTIQATQHVSRDDIADPDKAMLNANVTRVTLDRRTGYAMPDTDAAIYTRPNTPPDLVAAEGLHFKFPFGTKPRGHRFFDSTARHAYRMEFQSATRVDGMLLYHFRSDTPVVDLAQSGAIPAKYLGVDGEGDITVTRYYTAARELWVEPVTGMIVDAVQQARHFLSAAPTGAPQLTMVEIDARWDEATRAGQLADVRDIRSAIVWGLHRGPWLAAVTAAVLSGVAALVVIRHRRRGARLH